jgi:hypothetical protein
MEADLFLKIAVVAAVALMLGWRLVVATRTEHLEMASMLDPFLSVIEGATLTRSPWRYPRIDGALDGHPFRVDLVPDTLITRTLPTLWLEVRWAFREEGRFCVTVDPVGTEYFSDDQECGVRLEPPDQWHIRTNVRADRSGRALVGRLTEFDLTKYPSLKRVTMRDGELRATLRCARGERQIYRVLRAARFPADCVSAALVTEALSVARDVRDALKNDKARKEAG